MYFNQPELGRVIGVVIKLFQQVMQVIYTLYMIPQPCLRDVFAEIETLLDLTQFKIMVPSTEVVHLSGSLILYDRISAPVSNIIGLAPPPNQIIRLVPSGSGFARMDRLLDSTSFENKGSWKEGGHDAPCSVQ